jgi:hypothetical protein
MDSVFSYAATNSYAPTVTSRLMYLWSMSVATAYNWVTGTSPYTTKTDGWTWSTTHLLPNQDFATVWMTQCLTVIMPSLIPTYNPLTLVTEERTIRGWTQFEQTTQVNYVRTAGNFTAWETAWRAWFVTRTNDGSVAAAVAPTDDLLPNGSIRLNPAATQNITAYPNPQKWTPLILLTKTKNYATRLWETVTPVELSAENETAIKATVAAYFPTTTDQRNAELQEVVDMTTSLGVPGTLSDAHKIQAEFWAGGPYTITPPGMFMWLLKQYFITNNVYDRNTFIYSALDLAIQLFEVGRVVWGIKLQYQQARPIQDIRRIYANRNVGSWRRVLDPSGNFVKPVDISGNRWMPYQEANFVTPPFPDFVSGHSSFSQIFALVMTDWFGPTIPTTAPALMTDLNRFSPMFPTTDTQPYGTFVISSGSSKVEPGLVPAAPVTLQFNTWSEIAESAGISRQWGGIHAMSAHLGGVATANAVHSILHSKSRTLARRKMA